MQAFITGITIKNIGIIADAKISTTKDLNIFYGDPRQGKTTILNCFRWASGGAFPSDILHHGAEEGFIEVKLSNGFFRREFYVGRDKVTRARDIKFQMNGVDIDNPYRKLQSMINPFLVDQDYLRNMGEAERRKFFTQKFNTSTPELDDEQKRNETEARNLRAAVAAAGDIDVTPVEKPNIAAIETEKEAAKVRHAEKINALKNQLATIDDAHARLRLDAINKKNDIVGKWKADCTSVDAQNRTNAMIRQNICSAALRCVEIDKEIAALQAELETKRAIANCTAPTDQVYQTEPDTSLLDAIINSAPDTASLVSQIATPCNTSDFDNRIADARVAEVTYNAFLDRVKKNDIKNGQQDKVRELEHRNAAIREERAAKLKAVSETCGIPGLVFDDAGDFSFESVTSSMLSDSQLIRMTDLLSATYNDGFQFGLVDRAESLGEDIYRLIEYADSGKRTVLATVVGDKPSNVPAEVGVWVVKNGKVEEIK